MKSELKFLKFLLGILTIVIVLSLYNCGPEKTECDNWPDGVVKTYYHFEEDTLKIPYHGFDTLKFLRITKTDTDTVAFYGQGKKYYTITETDYDFYGCQHDDIYDAYNIIFEDNMNSERILLEIFVVDNGYAEFSINYKSKTFNDVLWIIDNPSMTGFINEFRIHGIRFSRVIPIPPVNEWKNYTDTLYYNKINGLVRFAFDSTYSITLIK